jgi:phosphoserine aminotransferase
MSSNFCSKRVDWSKYAVVYAGAHKNVGPSGVCILVVREDVLGKERPDTPYIANWKSIAEAPTQFLNTPCNWGVYVCGLNLAMMREQGIDNIQELAKLKANMFYDYMDKSEGYYTTAVDKNFRSRMNIPFRVKNDAEFEKKFSEEAAKEDMINLEGHVVVGACRASFYNAMPVEGVQKLIDFMAKFKKANP